jgi:hypothetical protein
MALSEGEKTLIYYLVAEMITGPEDAFISAAMQRGTDLEPLARKRYEAEKFTTVEQVGYVSKGEFLGVSPDGLVGDVGGIEIKCPGGTEFVRFMDTEEIDKKYMAQCQWAMYLTGRGWWDFVMFHPEFEKDILIKRLYQDPGIFAIWDKKIPHIEKEMRRLLEKAQSPVLT